MYKNTKCDLCGKEALGKQAISVNMTYGNETRGYYSDMSLCESCMTDLFNKIKSTLTKVGTPLFIEIKEGVKEEVKEKIEDGLSEVNEETKPIKKINPNVKKKEIDEEDFNNIMIFKEKGFNESETSRRLKIILSIIREAYKFNSYQEYTNYKSMDTTIDSGKCIALFKAGWFIDEIVSELQCSRATVTEILSTLDT